MEMVSGIPTLKRVTQLHSGLGTECPEVASLGAGCGGCPTQSHDSLPNETHTIYNYGGNVKKQIKLKDLE